MKRKEREAEEAGDDGEGEGGDGEVGEDGEPVKKKTKVRGGRRGKTVRFELWRSATGLHSDTETDSIILCAVLLQDEKHKDDGALPGWSARKSGTFATSGTGPASRGRGRGGARGGGSGRGRSDGGGRGGGGGGGGRYWQPTGSNATTVG